METKETEETAKSKETAKEFLKLGFELANLELDLMNKETDWKKLAMLYQKQDLLDKIIRVMHNMISCPKEKDNKMLKQANTLLIGFCEDAKEDVELDIKLVSTLLSIKKD